MNPLIFPRRRLLAVSLYLLMNAFVSAQTLAPTSPPSLTINAGAQVLLFEAPEIEIFKATSAEGSPPVPVGDYSPAFELQENWPKALRLTPTYDPTRTHILGNLFRSFRPESLHVTSLDGVNYRRGIDFEFNEERGLIANREGRMSGRITAQAEAALQRLDLVQRDQAGRLSVKKGASVWVCPELPVPDANHTAIAGIYIAPWRAAHSPHFDGNAGALTGASEYAITAHEIFPIAPASATETLFAQNLIQTHAKLRAGESVKIAFMGDSITLGAEATRWWEDRYDAHSTTWKGRLIHGLRLRFPKSKIDVIEAYRGGTTIAYGLERISAVLSQRPDLVIVAFGANDADGPTGEPPRTSPQAFADALASLADQSQAAEAEVLFVTPFPIHPWLRNGAAQRLTTGFIPELKRVAKIHHAAVADVHTDYLNLNTRGIPYWSQNHNWTNHPGNLGHRIYAETILRGFAP